MSDPSKIVDAIITNEPAMAVDAFQEMVRGRAREMVIDRYYPQAEPEQGAEDAE